MVYDNKIDDVKILENYSKARAFFENKIQVHILKSDREWFNGEIKSITWNEKNLRQSFLTINERVKGKKDIFFFEIFLVNRFEVIKK